MKPTTFISILAGIVILGWVSYICVHLIHQQPRISLADPQYFGLVMFKGGYNSYYLSFRDGVVIDEQGRRRWAVVGEDGKLHPGYRIIPHYKHINWSYTH